MTTNNWTPTTQQLPPDGEVVETRIGNNNKTVMELKRLGDIWVTPITNSLVYYTPTHWRKKEKQ